MNENTHVIHFGIYPINSEDEAAFGGYRDSRTHHTTWFKTALSPIELEIEGSWKCWGTADQDTDGDNSLHLWFFVRTDVSVATLVYVHEAINRLAEQEGCRALDYAVITTEDWSTTVKVTTFHGIPAAFIVEGEA
jgi:hypothetical protein